MDPKSNPEAYRLIKFPTGQSPFDIGSLERDAMTYLGDWRRYKGKEEAFGFYHRLGIKTGVTDAEGDPVTVFLHFVAPFTKEGQGMTPQIEATIDERVERTIQEATVQFSQFTDNAAGFRITPPEYMMRELYAILPK